MTQVVAVVVAVAVAAAVAAVASGDDENIIAMSFSTCRSSHTLIKWPLSQYFSNIPAGTFCS